MILLLHLSQHAFCSVKLLIVYQFPNEIKDITLLSVSLRSVLTSGILERVAGLVVLFFIKIGNLFTSPEEMLMSK